MLKWFTLKKRKKRIESKEKRQILKCKILELFTFKM